MPTRKRINLGGHKYKGKHHGKKNNNTVDAPVNDIDSEEQDMLPASERTDPSEENVTTQGTLSEDLNPNTSTLFFADGSI